MAFAALIHLMPGSASAGSLGNIYDFMIMDVCLGIDNSILRDAIPGGSNCKRRRDIAAGEQPPYFLQNFASSDAACRPGMIRKVNLPVQKGKTIRVVSSTERTYCGSPPASDDEDSQGRNGASIQWYDKGYGFIMGSYSPVSLSSFESDLCANDRNSSHRFFRGWVIAPFEVPDIASTGFGVFPSKHHAGAPAEAMGPCAKRYNRGLTAWLVDDFTYKSGRKFTSIISSHYSRSAPDAESPGDAMQVEQTYWTRELGLSRWEKWSREDWIHPRSKKTSRELGLRLRQGGRCSSPPEGTKTYNQQMLIESVPASRYLYEQTIRNKQTGEEHRWFMTLCEDYTNVIAAPATAGNPAVEIGDLADDLYWR
jgi:hypothetical protein